jgi:hypothetical protein
VHVATPGRPDALRDAVTVDDERERPPSEVLGLDAAAESGDGVRPAHLDDLETGMIRVRDEHECPLGDPTHQMHRELAVRVARRHEAQPLQLDGDRVESAPLVIGRGRRRRDTFERRDHIAGVG